MVTVIKRKRKREKTTDRDGRKEKTEVHLFDTESLRKCRGMSRMPVCARLCVYVH